MGVVRGVSLNSPGAYDETDDTPWIMYHNVVTAEGLASQTEDDDHPVTNLANPATHLIWMAGINTAEDEYVTLTTGYISANLDYMAIAKHNFGTIGATISVEGRIDDGFSPEEPYNILIDPFIPADDSPLMMRFAPQTLTHIRLRIQNWTDTPQAAVMYVGLTMVMERGIKVDVDHVPLYYGRRSVIVNGMSESGNFLGRVVLREFRESNAEFAHVTPEWFRTTFDDFIASTKDQPFFYAWAPTTYPGETGYAWLINDPQPETSPVTRRVSFNLEMRGISS